MSSLSLPGALRISTFSLSSQNSQLMHGGDLGESGQVIDLLKDRWIASLSFTAMANISTMQKQRSAAIQAYFGSLRGMVNTIQLHSYDKTVPLGTLRGSPTLAVSAAQGADQLTLNCAASAKLLPGDMLGLAGRLYQVRSACAESGGIILVPLVNRVRSAAVIGSAVVWDRPSIPMRRISGGIVTYSPGMIEISPIDLIEAITA
jgi:hypothetical protein